ncbi:response regulator [Variovorax dokdonensis]|uniref:histidine kinase n=1 Tax=Variovorax dokdonensis TaxID=344883 RepID=A0ABT7NGQ5_9BURK|nr:ATP-binding protein [Variovorax dokdonensis]MDM0047092.1 response regulator [Variovorax dokdonensis]
MGRLPAAAAVQHAAAGDLSHSLHDRAEFESLLIGISERMGEIVDGDFLVGVEASLRQLIDYLGYDRCTFSEFIAGDYLNVLCSVGAGDVPPLPRGRFDRRLPWFLSQLRSGQVVQMVRLPEDLPPEAADELAHVISMGLLSHLSIPLHMGGRVTAVLSFAAFRQHREWSMTVAARLKMVGQFLAGLLALARSGEEVRHLRERIWHADRVQRLSTLSAAIAHQVNQPLAAILSNAQAGLRYIERGNASPVVMREVLEAVEREEKRAAQTIRAMRSLMKREDTRCERFELAGALEEVLRLLGAELQSQGIRVQTRFDRSCQVSGDRTQLEQVLLNLMFNAAAAMQGCQPADRLITVEVSRGAPGKVLVKVSDAGQGIAARDLETIFEPFWTTRQEGLGLGLAICRSIVETHNGRIWGKSSLGHGTTFHVELPLADAEKPKSQVQAPMPARIVTAQHEASPTEPAAPLVCVVDDDGGVRESLVRLLDEAGWSTTSYASADEFLAEPPEGDVACLVLDMRMPGISGPQLQQQLVENGISAPVIFVTGHGDVAAGIDAMKLGAVDFLEKPVDEAVLLAAVQRACDRHAAVAAQAQVLAGARQRMALLSSREREIVGHVVRGRLNKQIAADLGISEQTVKQHRGRVMEKMGVRSLADLVRACEAAGVGSAIPPK